MGKEQDRLSQRKSPIFIAPSITTSELLGKSFEEPGGLSLAESPLFMAKITEPTNDLTEYVIVPNSRLTTDPFLQLLSHVAPLQPSTTYYESDKEKIRQQRVNGILDDWIMPDRDNVVQLQHDHKKSLGEHWSEFGRHRLLFMETLRYGSPFLEEATKSFLLYGSAKEWFIRNASGWIDRGPNDGWPYHKFFRPGNGGENIEAGFLTFIGDRGLTKEDLAKLGFEDRWEPMREYISTFPVDQQRKLVADFCSLFDTPLIPYDDLPGPSFTYKTADDLEITITANQEVQLTYSNILKGRAVIVESWPHFKIIPESVTSTNFLVPVIRLQERKTQRYFNFDFLNQNLATHCLGVLGNLPTDLSFDHRRLNPLAGLLFVAYFSPEIRSDKDIWPLKQGLEKGGRENFMGPAQLPVLALQRREKFAWSEFLSRSVEYIEQYAV